MDARDPATALDASRYLPPPPAPQAPRGSRLRGLLAVLALAAGGAVVGTAGAMLAMRWFQDSPGPSVGWWLAGLLLGFWPHVVLHEAGHALAGLARGMRPVAFGVGPLRWDRGEAGWRFRRARGVAGIGGFAALLPEGRRGLSRADQAAYLLGGPLANLLTAAACGAVLATVAVPGWLGGALLGFGLGAAVLGVANLVPFHSQGWRSDGRGLLDLLRHSPEADLQQRLHRLLALNMAGVRPRDWPDSLIPAPMAEAASSPILAINGALMRLTWAMDRDDRAGAADSVQRIIAAFPTLPVAFQPHVAVAVAGYLARQHRDPALLAAWRPLCEGGVTDLSPLRAWLDAEAACLTSDPAAATAVAGARAQVEQVADPVTRLLLHEYLDDLSRTLDTSVVAPASSFVKEA